MNPRAPQPRTPTYQLLGFKDFMEWDELASLAHRLTQQPAAVPAMAPATAHSPAAEFNSAWNVTMPATLAALHEPAPPAPFREAIEGLVMREVSEPEVFRHFFG